MGNDPAFLFYSSDFLTGTMTMTNEETGMYVRLLCLQHQKGKLSEKDMLFICTTYVEDVYCKFVKTEDGFYINERLQKEVAKRVAYSESRRNNISKRYLIEEKHNATYVGRMKTHMEDENENRNGIGISSLKEEATKGKPTIPPSDLEVSMYCLERKNGIQAKAFMDFYSARGWMLGKVKMKDWKAAVVTWSKNSYDKGKGKHDTAMIDAKSMKGVTF